MELTLSEIGGSALSLLPIGALGGSIAVVVVGASRRHGIATAVAAGVIVVMYLMNVLAGFIDVLRRHQGPVDLPLLQRLDQQGHRLARVLRLPGDRGGAHRGRRSAVRASRHRLMDTAPADPPGRLSRVFPIVSWLPSYKRADFRPDFLAGVIITCLLVPEGMAYAQIAGMPPQTAFYVAPPALLLYAIFASSRKLVVVVSSTQAALSAGAIGLVATVGTAHYAEMTAALALLVGLITMLAGVFRFGAWPSSSRPRCSWAS